MFFPEIIPRLHGEQAGAEADGQRREGQAGVEQDRGCWEAGETEGDDGLPWLQGYFTLFFFQGYKSSFQENISKLIQTIYHFAFSTYADLPRGPIKKNSMRKLTFTTLMEILPPELSDKINKKISETPEMRPDFISVIGMVSYL